MSAHSIDTELTRPLLEGPPPPPSEVPLSQSSAQPLALPPVDTLARVQTAASTSITPQDMVAALEAPCKLSWNCFLLGGPPLAHRGARHLIAGNYARAALYGVPGALLSAVGVVGDLITQIPFLVLAATVNGSRTCDGVWADRLAKAVTAHVENLGKSPNAACLRHQREQLNAVREFLKDKPHRARNDENIW